jgi:hypothetical protein
MAGNKETYQQKYVKELEEFMKLTVNLLGFTGGGLIMH